MLLALGLTGCKEHKSSSKLVINEVLITNEHNFQDDYGEHNAWVEIFNRSYGSSNLAACLLKVSNTPGDTLTYFIPKGDVLTAIAPRQHALFWADGNPNRGTFHTNFTLGTFSQTVKGASPIWVICHSGTPGYLFSAKA